MMELKNYLMKYRAASPADKNFYAYRISDVPKRNLKKILKEERALRLKSNLALMSLREKMYAFLPGFSFDDSKLLSSDELSARQKERIVEMDQALRDYAYKLDENSRLLDDYQLKIIDSIEEYQRSFLKAFAAKDELKEKVEGCRDTMRSEERYSSKYIDAMRQYVTANRGYLEATKDCALNLKLRDMKDAELRVVSDVANQADVVSFAIALQSVHAELMSEHLTYINSTLQLISDSVNCGDGIEDQMNEATHHIKRYSGLVKSIYEMKKNYLIRNMTEEGARLYAP